jgi:YVTN family beta-propeller protein
MIVIFSLLCPILAGQTAYVVNSGSMTLSRIDLVSGEVDNAFAILGNQANRVAVRGDHLYVVDSGDNNIRKLVKETGNTVGNIYIGASTNPYDILVLGDFAYVTGALSNRLYKIDLLTDTVIADIAVGNNPAGMAVWGSKLYVGNTDYASGNYESSLTVIDLTSFAVTGEISTDSNPQYLISYNNMIHVSCTGNWNDVMGSVQIIDPLVDEVIETLEIGGYPGSITAMNNGIIYIGDSLNLGVYAYNAEDLEIIYSAALPFTPGASTVAAADDLLFTLGGEWGQNFTLRVYNNEEELQNSFQVGLYATDLIIETAGSGAEEAFVEPEVTLTNYPNPFNPTTVISFQVSGVRDQEIVLCLYNIKGQKIKKYAIFNFQSSIIWDGVDETGKPVSSGIYYYSLEINGRIAAVKKCLLLK